MRVAITSAADRFDRIADEFSAVGLEAVSAPCIEVVPVSAERRSEIRQLAHSIGRVMLTSARTVETVWGDDLPATIEYFAVGTATASAVRVAGGGVRYAGRTGLAGLVEHLLELSPPSVFFPHASGTDLELLAPLVDASVELSERTAYHTRPISPVSVTADAITFASPSAVEGWYSHRYVEDVIVVAIGAKTAAALARHGVTADVLPQRPGFGAMADALRAFTRVETARTTRRIT